MSTVSLALLKGGPSGAPQVVHAPSGGTEAPVKIEYCGGYEHYDSPASSPTSVKARCRCTAGRVTNPERNSPGAGSVADGNGRSHRTGAEHCFQVVAPARPQPPLGGQR
jgi:hypothetical protein